VLADLRNLFCDGCDSKSCFPSHVCVACIVLLLVHATTCHLRQLNPGLGCCLPLGRSVWRLTHWSTAVGECTAIVKDLVRGECVVLVDRGLSPITLELETLSQAGTASVSDGASPGVLLGSEIICTPTRFQLPSLIECQRCGMLLFYPVALS
jgi:hypothetical protein